MNTDRLAADLRDALTGEFQGARDPLLDRLEPVSPSLWRFRFRWREEDGGSHVAILAARVGAEPAAARREARALEIAQRAGLAAPTVWLVEPWLIVDWIEGETFAAAWRRRAPRADPAQLAQALSTLHQATERPAERDAVGGRLSALTDRARQLGLEELAAAATALRSGRPPATTMALCHGDFRPQKLLLTGSEPTLVDWARSAVGDPRLDLAHASIHLRDEFGGALRSPFLRVYRQERSIAPDELAWFEQLAELERKLGEAATAA